MLRVATFTALSMFAAASALAQEPGRPVTQREITAVDVAATPVDDLNLRKSEVPALLIKAQEKPYDMAGLRRCSQIAAAVGELDAVLGEDLDIPGNAPGGPSVGAVAQYAVGSFIPFRGAIRELSGANAQERRLQAAIQAGQARRAFLKGAGQARGCRYPASAAPAALVEARIAEREAAAAAKKKKSRRPGGGTETASR